MHHGDHQLRHFATLSPPCPAAQSDHGIVRHRGCGSLLWCSHRLSPRRRLSGPDPEQAWPAGNHDSRLSSLFPQSPPLLPLRLFRRPSPPGSSSGCRCPPLCIRLLCHGHRLVRWSRTHPHTELPTYTPDIRHPPPSPPSPGSCPPTNSTRARAGGVGVSGDNFTDPQVLIISRSWAGSVDQVLGRLGYAALPYRTSVRTHTVMTSVIAQRIMISECAGSLS